MGFYRKKPITIEATQWFKDGDHPEVEALTGQVMLEKHKDFGWIKTLEGGMIVTPSDWIITGIHGEHYPCKDNIFRASYEEVEVLDVKEYIDGLNG